MEFENKKWLQNGFGSIALESIFKQNNISEFETSTNGYNLVNIGVGGTLKVSNLNMDLNLNINNLFNKSYISHLSRLKSDDIQNIGRNLIVSIKFEI